MNPPVVVQKFADELRRYSSRSFFIYRVVESGNTYPLVVDCSTLDEALSGGMVQCFHKDHLLIREVGDGHSRVHLYAIKKRSAPTYVYRDHQYHRQDRLYAAPVCSFDAAMVAGAGA